MTELQTQSDIQLTFKTSTYYRFKFLILATIYAHAYTHIAASN